MYKNGLVASIKINGQILREHHSEVYLPFNSTYEIYLKNTTSKVAKVDVYVDDREVITNLLLHPYSQQTISRFHEGHDKSGHSLKFIKMTEKIKNHRGSFNGDGILKVKWQYETPRVRMPLPYYEHPYVNDDWIRPNFWQTETTVDVTYAQPNSARCESCCNMRSIKADSVGFVSSTAIKSDGITVNGAPINQLYQTVYDNRLYESTINEILLLMKGETEKAEVKQEIVTNRKILCSICGTKNHSGNKFCRECGTSLI